MKIVSYNINGIRAAEKLGLTKWIKDEKYDVYCFQEIRANENVAKEILENETENKQISLFDFEEEPVNGLESYFKIYNCGNILGYAGTAILSKFKPIKIEYGMRNFWQDNEGRTTTIFLEDLIVVNAYIPNGNSRLEFKMKYLEALTKYLAKLKNEGSVVCVGDFNIANDEIDLTNPKECKNKSVFLPIERKAFKEILSLGFVDTFRYLYPDKAEYSWRSYRSRQENLAASNYNSWKYRIDYAIIYNKDYKILNCQMPDLPYSDHLPVILELTK